MNVSPIGLNANKSIKQWFLFPDSLPTRKFRGYEVRDDETFNQGAFLVGQNVKMSQSQTPTLRDGYEIIGTEATDLTPVKRAWVYETRDGVQIELKAYDTGIYAYVEGVSTDYDLLKASFTADKEWGFANIGQSGDTTGLVFFCNGTEYPFKWTGAYANYSSDNGSNQITVQGSVTLSSLGFTNTGTIIIGGVEITYTGLTNQTFTGCSAVPAAPTAGDRPSAHGSG
jgi:hypothetical protein